MYGVVPNILGLLASFPGLSRGLGTRLGLSRTSRSLCSKARHPSFSTPLRTCTGGFFLPEEGSTVRQCVNTCVTSVCGTVTIPSDHLKVCTLYVSGAHDVCTCTYIDLCKTMMSHLDGRVLYMYNS